MTADKIRTRRTPRKTVYRYDPVMFDMISKNRSKIPVGTRLVKMHPGHGAPKNGTMGMCYVEDADTGTFYGLVMLNSLVRA
jgi:hypothetical protein